MSDESRKYRVKQLFKSGASAFWDDPYSPRESCLAWWRQFQLLAKEPELSGAFPEVTPPSTSDENGEAIAHVIGLWEATLRASATTPNIHTKIVELKKAVGTATTASSAGIAPTTVPQKAPQVMEAETKDLERKRKLLAYYGELEKFVAQIGDLRKAARPLDKSQRHQIAEIAWRAGVFCSIIATVEDQSRRQCCH